MVIGCCCLRLRLCDIVHRAASIASTAVCAAHEIGHLAGDVSFNYFITAIAFDSFRKP